MLTDWMIHFVLSENSKVTLDSMAFVRLAGKFAPVMVTISPPLSLKIYGSTVSTCMATSSAVTSGSTLTRPAGDQTYGVHEPVTRVSAIEHSINVIELLVIVHS